MIRIKQRTGKKQGGFTLIELMIVVAIIGILAAVALPLLMSYLTSSKGAEGDLQIDNIENLAKKYYYKNDNSFPQGNITDTPNADCCKVAASGNYPARMCAPAAADWNVSPWSDMHFKMTDKPFRFSYSYAATDAVNYVASAHSDLDCDPSNLITTITTTGSVVNGEPSNVRTRTDEN